MKDQAFAERCRSIKLLLTDVDGVLTDGTLLVLPGGGEAKSFHVRDGLGIGLARRAGLRIGLLSGRRAEVVERRAAELQIELVLQGVADKGAELRRLLEREGLEPHEVAYMGDDVNDLAPMALIALSAAPADAQFEVRAQAYMVTEARGGQGCLREFIEAILKARGDWERVTTELGFGGAV
jgi:3-deoxy-D-manno-octulosonate 8-phosphate phosphatase (KDO 8-P phosphatase)